MEELGTSPPIFYNRNHIEKVKKQMILSIISQGFVWAILGLGIFMTFRILNFPDMTTEGSFPSWGSCCCHFDNQRRESFFSDTCCCRSRLFGWIGSRTSLYKREDPNLALRDFGDDFLSLYHALDYGSCEFRPAWNQANSGCFAF